MADTPTSPGAGDPQPLPQGGEPIPAAVAKMDTKADAKGPVEARVLIAFDDHQPNDVVKLAPKALAAAIAAGRVDPTDEAVAAAKAAAKG